MGVAMRILKFETPISLAQIFLELESVRWLDFATWRMATLAILILLTTSTSSIAGESTEKSKKKKLRAEIISVFRKNVELTEDFPGSGSSGFTKSGKPFKEAGEARENYHENVFIPLLEPFKALVCSDGDRQLLSEFMMVLIATPGSADETPSWVLGDIYLCRPDLVAELFKKLGEPQKDIIFRALDWGFQNVTYEKEIYIPNYWRLQNKLWELLLSGSDKNSRAKTISTFTEYKKIIENFNNAISSGSTKTDKPYVDIIENRVKFYNDSYLPKLDMVRSMVCAYRDKKLLSTFLDVFLTPGATLDEFPTLILGEIYLCQSDLVIEMFRKLENPQKKIVYDALREELESVKIERQDRIATHHRLRRTFGKFSESISPSLSIKNMSKSEKMELRAEIISVFNKYLELREDSRNSNSASAAKSNKSFKEQQEPWDNYHENVFLPILDSLKTIVCADGDRQLLSEFMRVLIATPGSADETPHWVLGDIYLCQPDLVISLFKKLDKPQKELIYGRLSWGFSNVTYKKEHRIPNYQQLENRLSRLRLLIADKNSRAEMISAFREYKKINEDYDSIITSGVSKSGKPYKEIKEISVKYYDHSYIPHLYIFSAMVCFNKDRELLSEFLDVYLSPASSLDSRPTSCLGGIYDCQPDLALELFRKLEKPQQKIIYEALREQLVSLIPENQYRIKKYNLLLKRLEELEY